MSLPRGINSPTVARPTTKTEKNPTNIGISGIVTTSPSGTTQPVSGTVGVTGSTDVKINIPVSVGDIASSGQDSLLDALNKIVRLLISIDTKLSDLPFYLNSGNNMIDGTISDNPSDSLI